MTEKILELKVGQIRLDGDTQMRIALNSEKASEYAEEYRQKKELPMPVVFSDGGPYWLADGFHRVHGMKQAKMKTAWFRVFAGTKRDAFLYAVGTNSQHGLRRTPADVRHCIRRMLKDKEWGQWNHSEIARQCKADRRMVADEAKKLKAPKPDLSERTSEKPKPAPKPRTYRTRHGTTATMDTSRIGRKPQKEKPVCRETEPDEIARRDGQALKSLRKGARQGKGAGWDEARWNAEGKAAWDAIPVTEE